MTRTPLTRPRLASVRPLAAISGGRVTVRGSGIGGDPDRLPVVTIGDVSARVVYADHDTVACCVPDGLEGGATKVRLSTAPGETAFLVIGTPVATGLHQVDSPVFDADGAVYLIEANPNPQLSYGEDFAESAEHAGISYEQLLQRIVNLGLNYRAQWQIEAAE